MKTDDKPGTFPTPSIVKYLPPHADGARLDRKDYSTSHVIVHWEDTKYYEYLLAIFLLLNKGVYQSKHTSRQNCPWKEGWCVKSSRRRWRLEPQKLPTAYVFTGWVLEFETYDQSLWIAECKKLTLKHRKQGRMKKTKSDIWTHRIEVGKHILKMVKMLFVQWDKIFTDHYLKWSWDYSLGDMLFLGRQYSCQ